MDEYDEFDEDLDLRTCPFEYAYQCPFEEGCAQCPIDQVIIRENMSTQEYREFVRRLRLYMSLNGL